MTVVEAPPLTPADVTVRAATSLEGIERLCAAWLPGPNITTDPKYFVAVVAGQNAERPHVLVAERGERVVAMLVARLERMPIRCRIGYRTLWAPRLRTIVVVHDGFLGETSDAVARTFVASLRRSLDTGEAEAVFVHGVRPGSALARAMSTFPRTRRQIADNRVHRQLVLPETFDLFMASFTGKSRSTMGRYARRLERAFAGELELKIYDDPAGLETVVRDLERVASTTYQKDLGVGFEVTPLVRRVMRLTMSRGQFRAYVLYIRGEPVAFWQGYLSEGSFRIGFTGFDPAFREHRLGTYVLLEVIADCCRREDVQVIDFGAGEAEYKRRFGNESWLEADVLLYGRHPRLIAVNGVRSTTIAANRALAALARRSERLRRAHREWRSRARAS